MTVPMPEWNSRQGTPHLPSGPRDAARRLRFVREADRGEIIMRAPIAP